MKIIGRQVGWDEQWLVMIVSMTGGAILRFWQLGAKSLWLDEAHAVNLLRLSFSDFWAGADPYHPPLHFLLLGAVLPPKPTEFWLRFPSAVAGCLTIPFCCLLGRLLWGRNTGSSVALLAAFSPLLIWYSQEGRSYALVTMFMMAAMLATVLLIRRPRAGSWLMLVITAAIAVHLHYCAWLLLPLSGFTVLALTATQRFEPQGVWWWLGSWTAILLACLPWMMSPAFASFVKATVSPDNYAYRLVGLSGLLSGIPPAKALWIEIALLGGLGFAAAIAFRSLARGVLFRVDWTGLRENRWVQAGALGLFLMLLAATVVTRGYTIKKLLSPVWPYALLLFAWLWPWARHHLLRLLAPALLSAGCSLGVALWVPKASWHAASDFLLQHRTPHTLILLEPAYMTVPFDYYDSGRMARAGVVFGAQPHELKKITASVDDIWFGFDPRDSDPEQRNLHWLMRHATTVERVEFYRLRLYRFRLDKLP